jgi:two-component system, OmpR family, osmolarity sensor histidine kinase EnvZ
MKLNSRSIVARVAWLIAIISIFSFALHIFVVSFWIRPLFDDMATAVAGQVTLVRALITQAPAGNDAAMLQRLLPANIIIERLPQAPDVSSHKPPPLARSRMQEMQDKLPEGIQFHITTGSDVMAPDMQWLFDFQHNQTYWRMHYSVSPPVMALFGSIFGWLALIALAISLSLFVGVRLVTRPMSNFANQIAAQGHQIQTLPEPARASPEILTMVRAFNQLVDKVKQADAKKLQMLAGLSHDLRTPLTRLRLRLETQFSGPETEDLALDIDAMQNMVNQFMAYVHGDSQASLGQPDSVIEQILHVISHYPNQACRVNFMFNDPELKLPDLAFQRLLTNLLDNAFTYGEPPVEVLLFYRETDGMHEAVLTVYDCGAGMNAEDFLKAQQPFVRLEHAKSDIGHSGLGLAIVAQIANQLNGVLQSERESQKGFGISFAWPMTQPHASYLRKA